ncbi:MAG: hypothetical protein QXH91_07340 [Candidatus Bathyarchaeia archaeon]
MWQDKFTEKLVNEKIIPILMKTKGIEAVYIPSMEDRNEILKLEKEAEKKCLAGYAKGFNLGLRKVLEKEVVLALVHNENFDWGDQPTVQLICGNDVVGEEIKDKKKFLELKAKGDVILFGDSFGIYTSKIDLMKKASPESIYFLFPPLRMRQIENVPEICDIVLSIPTTASDIYLKERMKAQGTNVSKRRLGTALLGFNIRGKKIP